MMRDKYKPPEINSDSENFLSDVYGLGVAIEEVARRSSFILPPRLSDFLSKMRSEEMGERPSLEDCIQFLGEFSKENKLLIEELDSIYPLKGSSFKQPQILSNIQKIRTSIGKEQKMKANSGRNNSNRNKLLVSETYEIIKYKLEEPIPSDLSDFFQVNRDQVFFINPSSPLWLPDNSTEICTSCASPFTFLNRRHHCRLCGRIFCKFCCHKKVSHNGRFAQRVCEECANIFLLQKAK